MENSVYYDVQRLSRTWFWISTCLIDAVLLYVLLNMFAGNFGLFLSLFVTLILLFAAALDIYIFRFLKLTVKIDYDSLYITLFPFFSVTIPVNEIYLTEKTAFRRFRDYGGAGLGNSFNNCDPAYFLNCKTGVRIYYPDSNKLIVGAADPQKIINAIQYSQQRKRILSEMN